MEIKKIVDNLVIYDPQFSSSADAFVSDTACGGVVSDSVSVSTMDEMKSAFDKFSQVGFVEFLIHGTPGMFHFANGCAMVGHYLNTLCTNLQFLRKDARILFDNCSIGDGNSGDAFLDSIGSGLLKGKGGTVGATTVTNWTFKYSSKVFMKPLSFGRLKVRRYDASGNLVGSQTVDRHGILR
jgi:hypothetical protein